ncbi:MAG: hypothetical protein R2864_03870 [Syntrophotaleaceae bacterium]
MWPVVWPWQENSRDQPGVGAFAMLDAAPGPDLVREAGFPVDLWDGREDEAGWLAGLLAGHGSDGLILDVRSDLAGETVARWRRKAAAGGGPG